MLKKFSVKNFKGFEKEISIDFTVKEYPFNEELICNGLVNKAILYGKNGVGKSSLGIAIFDIVSHLTDKQRIPDSYVTNYRNLNHPNDAAVFRYDFKFDNDEVTYIYSKFDAESLMEEKLFFNGRMVIDYNYNDPCRRYISEDISGGLNIDLTDNKLSVVKYIYRNMPTHTIPLLTKMMQFCENMLWYRSLSDGNVYTGFTNGAATLTGKLYESGKVIEFEKFLENMGVNYKLRFEAVNGAPELFVIFDNDENKASFLSLASTGTMALFLYYVWSITAFEKVSFLFIDEFDAFLHYEASESIVMSLNESRSFQSMLTTHNTDLMNNKTTRPDCCYIMTSDKICSLSDASDRELREGHNLAKLYKSGEFNA